ncbi:hypothetical protein AB0J82_34755 [Asanoa sp. NPDC049518]|uniref:DUF6896 domain-containing protein n=1 Tax=unclassified Asanoa TaxID=2685164 RepID=UPI0034444487
MIQDPAAVREVRRFAAALRDIRGRLFHDLSPVTDVAGLLKAVRATRELPREGVTASGIEFLVHGAGRRMTAADGQEVDVDLVADPATGAQVEAFDAWRIRWFLDEAADDGLQAAEVNAACRHLVGSGELREVVPDRWFALKAD